MSNPPQPTHHEALAEAIEAYLLGTLSDEQINGFEADLLCHPDAADLCAEAMETVAMTREVFRDDQEQRVILKHDQTLEGFHGLLAELGEAEARAEAELVHIVGQVEIDRPLWQQWRFVIPGAIAALLAIAVILIVALPGAVPPTNTPVIVQSPNRSAPTTSAKSTVATLTATHNAQWADGPASVGLATGGTLHPGDRITLTAGFAKITTNDGAIVILEAPCTVQMIDSPNALRLHSGKLVGICETPSSKGLLVRTPHMDVIDLGTQFGIDASRVDASVVNVFDGEVTVSAQNTAGPRRSVLLKADEAVAIDMTGEARRVEPNPLAFVRGDEFDAIVKADTSAAHRWQAYTAQLRRDPDLLALYAFDGDEDQAVANNSATPGAKQFHARMGDGRDHTIPSRSADRFGQSDSALAFDRQQLQALYVPDWHQAGPLDALTVSCWFKLQDNAGDWPLLVTHWHDARDDSMSYAFHLGVYNAARNSSIPGQGMGLQAHVSHTGGRQSNLGWDVKHEGRDGGAISPSDDWVHVALTIQCGGGPIRLYKNGIEIDTNGAIYEPAHLPNSKRPLVIGGKSTYRGMDRKDISELEFSGFFQGEIDDVVLIGRALTQDDIQDMYRAGTGDPD